MLLKIGGSSGVFTGRGGFGSCSFGLIDFPRIFPLRRCVVTWVTRRVPFWPPLCDILDTPWVGGGQLADKNSLYRRLRRELPLRRPALHKSKWEIICFIEETYVAYIF